MARPGTQRDRPSGLNGSVQEDRACSNGHDRAKRWQGASGAFSRRQNQFAFVLIVERNRGSPKAGRGGTELSAAQQALAPFVSANCSTAAR